MKVGLPPLNIPESYSRMKPDNQRALLLSCVVLTPHQITFDDRALSSATSLSEGRESAACDPRHCVVNCTDLGVLEI